MKKNKTPFCRPALTEQELIVLLDGLNGIVEELKRRGVEGNYLNGVLSLRKRLRSGLKRVRGLDCPLLWERKRELLYVKDE